MHKISIGVNWQGPLDLDATIEEARIADDSGVHLMSVAEAWGRDAFVILTALAGATQRVHLGTSIVNIFSRSPAALAQAFITLDTYFGQRMVIGIGSSGPQVIEHFHGVKFEKPFTRVREYVEIINMLMRKEKLDYQGDVHQLARGFTLRFDPVRSHIPIWIASITPKSVKQTAAIADGWMPIFIPRDRWREQLAAFEGAVREAGRRPQDVQVRCPYNVTVTSDPQRVIAARRANAAFYIARMGDFYYQHFVRMGYRDAADAVRKAWAEGGSSAGAAALPDALVDQLGMAGELGACIDALDAAQEAGFSLLSVGVAERDPEKRAAIYRQLVG